MERKYVWSLTKALSNERKHGVSFEAAATVFSDPLAKIVDDEYHSEHEFREIAVGHDLNDRLIVVVFTEKSEDTIRIISARRATKHERRLYEEADET